MVAIPAAGAGSAYFGTRPEAELAAAKFGVTKLPSKAASKHNGLD
jgi:hypothetical protein